MDRRILGDYEIVKLLGQGGLGSVFLAEHRFTKQQCALKVLPEELASDRGFVQRFEEEVARLAQLSHPYLTKIHHVSFADGLYFLVTDCIVDEAGESVNLGHYLMNQVHPLDEEEVIQVLSQVGEALDYLHERPGGGIIHRGLKLSNILVKRGGRRDLQVVLADTGLSRVVGVGAVLTRLLKQVAEGLDVGSAFASDKYANPPIDVQKRSTLHQPFLQAFPFLAPEQKRFEKEVTPAADVYAFGVLAYHLLTGLFPEGVFDSPCSLRTEFQRDWDTLLWQCLRQDPVYRPAKISAALGSMGIARAASGPEGFYCAIPVQAAVEEEALRPVISTCKLERPGFEPDPLEMLKVESGVQPYVPTADLFEGREVEPLRTDMMVVKGGSFSRGSEEGSRDEMPRHRVGLSSFAMDIHPVTNEQFVRFLEAMGGEKDVRNHDMIRLKESRIRRSGGKLSIESGYAKHPVVGVTWYGAKAYASWVGKRLPTEAEWEVAAAAGEAHNTYPTGENIEKNQANFFSSDTTAVMSYPPSPLGLYDMAGNVYEWCQDWYGYNYYETSSLEPENPKGPMQGVYRVLRGGCWKSLKEDLRCSHRHRNNPGTVNGTYGFRCAADVQ